jgi:chromosome segregation ATPase
MHMRKIMTIVIVLLWITTPRIALATTQASIDDSEERQMNKAATKLADMELENKQLQGKINSLEDIINKAGSDDNFSQKEIDTIEDAAKKAQAASEKMLKNCQKKYKRTKKMLQIIVDAAD